jgi:hypothetical protein
MRRFYFNLVHHDEVEPIGHPVADRGQAIAVAQRLAIDIAENRRRCRNRNPPGKRRQRGKERLMIARLSALDATFAPRGPQEGIMGKHCGSLSTRRPTEPPYVVNCKTSTGLWKPLFNAKGEGTVSAPDGRARCHEGAAAQGAA